MTVQHSGPSASSWAVRLGGRVGGSAEDLMGKYMSWDSRENMSQGPWLRLLPTKKEGEHLPKDREEVRDPS